MYEFNFPGELCAVESISEVDSVRRSKPAAEDRSDDEAVLGGPGLVVPRPRQTPGKVESRGQRSPLNLDLRQIILITTITIGKGLGG